MRNPFKRAIGGTVEKRVETVVEKKLGNKGLAYMSRLARGSIAIQGTDRVRKQVINGIEDDLKRAVKKNPKATVDELIADAANTPDYMALLQDLDMGEEHLRELAKESLEKKG